MCSAVIYHVVEPGRLTPGASLGPADTSALNAEAKSGLEALLGHSPPNHWAIDRLNSTRWPLWVTREELRSRGLLEFRHSEPPFRSEPTDEGWALLERPHNVVIELVAELVRQCAFPNMPSRLTGVFGFRQRAVAERFRSKWHAGNRREIWELGIAQPTAAHDLDASWLDTPTNLTALETIDRVKSYWSEARRPDHSDPLRRETLVARDIVIALRRVR